MDRPQQLNFTYLLNSGSSIDDLNEPNLAYEFPLSLHEDICDTRVHIDQEKSCNKKSQKQSIRTSNFSADENRLLIFAWLNTSQDTIKGSEQKRNQFWKRVTEYYGKHKTWAGNERSVKSLTNRWSKISTQVSKFCGYYAGIDHLRKSGYRERDKAELRFQQKWMIEHENIEASKPSTKNHVSINLEDDDGDSPEPATCKRPIGRKPAKQADKKAKSNEQGRENEESSKIRSELEEFRARRLESDRKKAEQLELLIATEQKQVALRKRT
ncbi:hypothetical protein ACLB2K_038194 [Fragaria x ananassa]